MSGPTPPDRGEQTGPGQQQTDPGRQPQEPGQWPANPGQPPGFGQPPSYRQQPGGNPQPPGQSEQPTYGQQQPGYGQQHVNYGQQPPGYGQQQTPYSQQGGFGPPAGFGPPPGAMGPQTTRMARLDPGPSQGFGVFGAVTAAIGAIAVVVSFFALDWFTKGTEPHSHFKDVHDVLNEVGPLAAGTAKAYFSWLGWALLVAVAVIALVANMPSPLATPFRIIGALAAAATIGVTFLAIKLISAPAGERAEPYSEYLKHTRIGFYVAIAGFLVMGIGAVIGPRGRR
jgi:hypothetical protein